MTANSMIESCEPLNRTKLSGGTTVPIGLVLGFWISTMLLALQMSFTAYAQLRLPQVTQAFIHLGFPAWFRIELSWAKLAGVTALLIPMVPARLKEWAYAGFAITLVSALIAHFAAGDGVQAWGWAAGTGILWVLSYFFFRRLQARAAGYAERTEESCEPRRHT
jgi:hypothetical protein